ncbi:hypothetical protein ABK040_004462 [Willaertia magna]
MVIFSMYILNKAGGLIYQRDFGKYAEFVQIEKQIAEFQLQNPNSPPPPNKYAGKFVKPSGNQYLTLASTFHGLHAISKELIPSHARIQNPEEENGGIEVLDADEFKMFCFNSPTLTKFFYLFDQKKFSGDGVSTMEEASRWIYQCYVDYVMKNPFYELEMPIKCALFDEHLDKYVGSLNSSLKKAP